MSTQAFARAFAFIVPHEAEFARGHWGDLRYVVAENVPGDAGGLTKWGIDQRSHPSLNIASLTEEDARGIYHGEWLDHSCDLLPDPLAIAAFDVFVNGGYAILWLQRAYNLYAKAGAVLKVDGYIGPKTVAALNAARPILQEQIVRDFLDERDDRFEALARQRGDQKFLAGWLQRDRDLAAYLLSATAVPTSTAPALAAAPRGGGAATVTLAGTGADPAPTTPAPLSPSAAEGGRTTAPQA